jgi:flavin reductase (DIM6/NTAB) family NADH-FMN oxidoreductase RutF
VRASGAASQNAVTRGADPGEPSMTPPKRDQPPACWDRLFAPSSCLAMITSLDAQGRVNAASYGTCTRVHHSPVCIAFTANLDSDTARNVLASAEFVVNLPRFDLASLGQVRVVGLPFAPGVNELEKAGLTALPGRVLAPPRIAECPRHFECRVVWTRAWQGRLMICGEVVAASVDADCVDDEGYVIWERVKPAHFCGAPYHDRFVAAYEVQRAARPYYGPEAAAFDAHEQAVLAGTARHSNGHQE